MQRTFLLAGALAGLIGVGFGAFGAHGLRGRLSPDMLAVFETGVRYQMYHALALMAIAALSDRLSGYRVVFRQPLPPRGDGDHDPWRHHAHRRRRVSRRMGVSGDRYALNRRTSIAYFRIL